MEIRISEMREIARRILSSGLDYHRSATEGQVETLRAYLKELGEYEDGMDPEEIACIVVLYVKEKERAKRIPSDNRSPLRFRRAR